MSDTDMADTMLKGAQSLEILRRVVQEAEDTYRARVLLCMTGCRSMGSMDLAAKFREKLATAGLADEVAIVDAGCHGQCTLAPAVVIEPQNFLYGGVRPEDVDEIIETSLKKGWIIRAMVMIILGYGFDIRAYYDATVAYPARGDTSRSPWRWPNHPSRRCCSKRKLLKGRPPPVATRSAICG